MTASNRRLILCCLLAILALAGCATAVPSLGVLRSDSSSSGEFLSGERQALLARAESLLRTPYRSPPQVPATFDCSSFVKFVYASAEYSLPAATSAYANVGRRVDWKDALPGDILVFSNVKGSSKIDHVAILYRRHESGSLAGSWIIHAASVNTGVSMKEGNPSTRTGVVITELGLRGDGVIDNEYFYQRFMYCVRVFP